MRILLNPFKSQLCVLSFIAFLLLFTPVLTANEPATKPTSQEFKQKTANLQMPFIANNGQMDGQVKFYAKTFGGTVFVTKEGEIVYALPMNSSECRGEWHSPSGISPLKRGEKGVCNKTPNPNDRNETHPRPLLLEGRSGVAPKEDVSPRPLRERDRVRGVSLKEELVGAKVKAIQGEEPSVTKVSYFKGNDPAKWKTNISPYDSVNLGEIYDGIELKLRAYGNNVEKLFTVKPGANPEKIKLKLRNPNSEFQNPKLSVNEQGELEVETGLGTVKFTKPVAYQEIDGKRVEVECKYTIADCEMQNAECKTNLKSKIRNLSSTSIGDPKSEVPKSKIENPIFEYGFTVASYDKTKDLIIDPLLASTYLGGSSDDVGYSLTLDTSGNVYVTGYTLSTDFPTTSGAYDTSFNGDVDVFVSKLDGALTSLLASTFLGGSSNDDGYSLTLDTSGDVYVTGYTWSTDFPTTSGVYDTSFNGGHYDVFISKLDSNLSSSDTTAPTGSISINSGAEYTNTTSVTLNLSATDEWGVTGYYGSTNPFKPSASDSGWTEITTTTIYNEDVPYQLD